MLNTLTQAVFPAAPLTPLQRSNKAALPTPLTLGRFTKALNGAPPPLGSLSTPLQALSSEHLKNLSLNISTDCAAENVPTGHQEESLFIIGAAKKSLKHIHNKSISYEASFRLQAHSRQNSIDTSLYASSVNSSNISSISDGEADKENASVIMFRGKDSNLDSSAADENAVLRSALHAANQKAQRATEEIDALRHRIAFLEERLSSAISSSDKKKTLSDVKKSVAHCGIQTEPLQETLNASIAIDDVPCEQNPSSPTPGPAYPLATFSAANSPLLSPNKTSHLLEINDSLIEFNSAVSGSERPIFTQALINGKIDRGLGTPVLRPRIAVDEMSTPPTLTASRKPVAFDISATLSDAELEAQQLKLQAPPRASSAVLLLVADEDSASDAPLQSLWKSRAATKQSREPKSSQVTASPATPDSKRRRMAPSASLAKTILQELREEEPTAINTASVYTTSFQPIIAAQVKPPSMLHQRSATVIDMVRTQSQFHLESAPIVAVIPVSAAESKRMSLELKRLRSELHLSCEWNARGNAIEALEKLIGDFNVLGWADWPKELEQMRPALFDQLLDTRSAICSKVTKCLVTLTQASPTVFEREFEFYAPYLFKGLYVTIKIIRESCEECLLSLVQLIHTPKVMGVLLSSMADNHPEVREKCAVYMTELLSSLPDPFVLDHQAADIARVIVTYGQDANSGTRERIRSFYRAYLSACPSRANAIDLPPVMAKALMTDVAKRNGESATGKRKGGAKSSTTKKK